MKATTISETVIRMVAAPAAAAVLVIVVLITAMMISVISQGPCLKMSRNDRCMFIVYAHNISL